MSFLGHQPIFQFWGNRMGRKIFVTYKYADNKVLELDNEETTARTYVDKLQEILTVEEHINKGEKDDADLSDFKDDTIQTKLGDKIFDSSVTIIIVSKGMVDPYLSEKDQWMPWEISYSLRKKKRGDRTSSPNALLAVVLPDELGSYEYFMVENSCPHCKCRTLNTNILFKIMKGNMFNIKKPEYSDCEYHSENSKVYTGNSSYIYSVKWPSFTKTPSSYIDKAVSISEKIDKYNIIKVVE
ncbi:MULTISPECIES: TIR domain-containing protein [Serratia]|uniref:TIR domain-containing protein n=1 Tax=Serratia TaxID=613 RepID=UPI0025AAD7FE|nr:TIR domain-containing protein [Serratia marcescens]MDN0028314.1 TIR domain-containing protein [Serratia marcescens]